MGEFLKRFNIFSKNSRFYTLLILMFALCAGYFYYVFSVKFYKSYTSIKVVSKDIETQKDILKSRRLISKTVDDLGLEVDYYTKGLFYRKIDLYAKKPFIIKDLKIKDDSFYDREFEIEFKDGNFILKEVKFPVFNDFDSESIKLISNKEVLNSPFISFRLSPVLRENYKKGYFVKFKKRENLISSVQKRVEISQSSKNSSILKISYFDDDPFKVKDFLNTLIKNYKERLKKEESAKISKLSSFLDSKIKEAKREMNGAFKRLKSYEDKNSLSIDPSPFGFSIGYEEELRKIKLELNTLDMIKREIKKGNYLIVSALERKYPELSSLAKEIEEKLRKKDLLKEKRGELDPEVILFSQKIEKLQKTLNKMIREIQNSLYKRVSAIKKVLNQKSEKLSKLPKKEKELIVLRQNYDISKNYYDYLIKERSELLLSGIKDNAEVSVIDPPLASKEPYKPKLENILLYAFLGGLFLAFLTAFFKNAKDNVVRSVNDVEEFSSLPLYGVIPFVNDHRLYNKIYVTEDIPSKYKEAYREIKTNIELLDSGWRSKIVGISSTIPGEGKSVFVSNLAATLAMGDQRVILICGDFMLSEIHKKFDLQNDKGLADLLEGRVKIEEVVKKYEKMKNLYIIPSGKASENPHKLIESKEMKLILKNLRRYFDFIVVDTTPIDVTNDSFVLLKECDLSIFVLKSEFSQKSFIRRIENLSKSFGLKNPGFVLTSVKREYINRLSYDEEYIFRKSE